MCIVYYTAMGTCLDFDNQRCISIICFGCKNGEKSHQEIARIMVRAAVLVPIPEDRQICAPV
jgi:hypothetical protein